MTKEKRKKREKAFQFRCSCGKFLVKNGQLIEENIKETLERANNSLVVRCNGKCGDSQCDEIHKFKTKGIKIIGF